MLVIKLMQMISLRGRPWLQKAWWQGFLQLIWWCWFLIICVQSLQRTWFWGHHIQLPFILYRRRQSGVLRWRLPFSSFRGRGLISFRWVIFQSLIWQQRGILFKRRFQPSRLRSLIKLRFQRFWRLQGRIRGISWLQLTWRWRCLIIQLRRLRQLT